MMGKNFNGIDRYAKVWCSIFSDTKFLSFSLAERGAWLQLIVWAKMTGDTGIITFRSWRNLAEILGCDKNTATRIILKFADESLLNCHVGEDGVVRSQRKIADISPLLVSDERKPVGNSLKSHHDLSGIITIEIVKYNEYQRVRKTELVSDERKPADISPTNQTRPDQTRPKKDSGSPKGSPEVQYWVGEYLGRLGSPYVFTKKDGVTIAAVVKAVGPDQYRKAVDWLLSTSEPWYSDKRTPAILRACINQILAKVNHAQPVDKWPEGVPRP
jgi:hypothetical protein